jgi:simple sugar transport system ATP-binding protein
VEILKALYRNARILILDEPTAVLTQIEADRLFSTLRTMSTGGLSIIFITHKLGEVMGASDRVVVLRAGKVVAERDTKATSREELAELMVGRRVARPVREALEPGPIILAAENVDVIEGGRQRLQDITFHIRAGEILGIIGVAGNGQSTLGRLCSGLAHPAKGRFKLGGKSIGNASAKMLVAAGVGRIPEDRLLDGTIGEMVVWENAIIDRVHEPQFSRHGLVDREAAKAHASELIQRFDVRGATPETTMRLLSGGNIQKFILGRNLSGSPRLLIANQPTRGLDEGAVAAVHAELLAARKRGVGVLLISEDLDEVMALSDRVQAIYKGQLSSPVDSASIDARAIGLMMGGTWEG